MGSLSKSFTVYTILQVIALLGTYPNIATSQITLTPDQWFQFVTILPEKYTTITVYVQDRFVPPGQTNFIVAQSNITAPPINFGLTFVGDEPLASAPALGSPIIARAQGIAVFADLNEVALYLNFNIVFTSGPYAGSTLQISGRNPLNNPVRELSIVGGTGIFRLARGIAVVTTIQPLNGVSAIFQYKLYIGYRSSF